MNLSKYFTSSLCSFIRYNTEYESQEGFANQIIYVLSLPSGPIFDTPCTQCLKALGLKLV